MKRLLIILITSITCLLTTQAQTRYVIAFDCTKSMNHPTGDYTKNGYDPYKIWIPAKKFIQSLWIQASDIDEFVILLYQDRILHTIKGFKGSQLSDWNSIESKMEDAITHGGNTCILHAWQTAEHYFTDNCDFYFITDGVEDHDNNNKLNDHEQSHIDIICKKIDEFCNLGINGFYTNLKQSENDNINNQISKKIKSSCFKDLIAGNITPLSLSLDQEDLSKGKKTFNLIFKPIESQRVAHVQKLDAVFTSNDEGLENANTYFRPIISGITNNRIELSIEQIKPVPQNLLDQSNSCKLFLNVTSLDQDVAIKPELITIDIRYYYEKIAYLPSLELEGTSKYHPAFCITPIANLFSGCDFIAEHKPDTITFDFKKLLDDNVLFNNEAIKHGSTYKLQLIPLRDKDENAKFILLKNEEICKNNTIDVASSDENILISIIFDKNSTDGTFKFNLVPVEPKELDKINECANIEEASIPLIIEFDKDYNPLSFLLFVVFVIFLLCCILRIIYIMVCPKMKGQISIQYPDIQGTIPYSIQGCKKFVFYKVEKKQSFISKLFFGITKTPKGRQLNNFWSSELVIIRNNSKSIQILCNENYLFNHAHRHTPLVCKQGRTMVTITNINDNISVILNY